MKKINTSIAIQILPNLEKEAKLDAIDKVIAYIKSKNLKTVVCPFETVIEGEFEEIMQILKECVSLAKDEGIKDFLAYIKLSFNEEGVLTIDEKISKHNR